MVRSCPSSSSAGGNRIIKFMPCFKNTGTTTIPKTNMKKVTTASKKWLKSIVFQTLLEKISVNFKLVSVWRQTSLCKKKKRGEIKTINTLTLSISKGMDSELGCSSTFGLTKTRIRPLKQMHTSRHLKWCWKWQPKSYDTNLFPFQQPQCDTNRRERRIWIVWMTWEDTAQHRSNLISASKLPQQQSRTSQIWKNI